MRANKPLHTDGASRPPLTTITVGQHDVTAWQQEQGRQQLAQSDWPEWWHWELELSPQLLKRMVDRGFSEAELRTMLHDATAHRPDVEPGRSAIDVRHNEAR